MGVAARVVWRVRQKIAAVAADGAFFAGTSVGLLRQTRLPLPARRSSRLFAFVAEKCVDDRLARLAA